MMKQIKFTFLVLAISLVQVFAEARGGSNSNKAPKCPSICVNLSGNSMYDSLCSAVGQAQGRQGCEKYANLGCAYHEGRAVPVAASSCVNLSNNSFYDSLCTVTGQARGQQGCEQYANLGCAWNAPQYRCAL